jgi:hypothetical protein
LLFCFLLCQMCMIKNIKIINCTISKWSRYEFWNINCLHFFLRNEIKSAV